jgi:hypothetical protein
MLLEINFTYNFFNPFISNGTMLIDLTVRRVLNVLPPFQGSHLLGGHTGTFLRRKEARDVPLEVQRGDYMPVSKKQLEKLNKIKKAKAEDLSKQADAGSKSAKKKLKKLEKKIK